MTDELAAPTPAEREPVEPELVESESGRSESGKPQSGKPRMRADAKRNTEQIRRAAIDAFRGRGLAVPLEDVAKAAGVSKATVFNRFGGRIGLIEAVIEELVAAELYAIVDHARTIANAGERIAYYLAAIRELQYRQPAVNDVLLQMYPESQQLMAICHVAGEFNAELIAAGHASGELRAEFRTDDLEALVHDSALALKYGTRPPVADYDRRTTFLLDGIRRPRE
ncbi:MULTISPECIES: TetR/AcrR family transcriptional regulator [Prauserella salsuginis group]|uniref:TetR/AcrR family transcriptional regulator n=1 Tax=Prauserella salsuginis TaxID=387889 RepID=A0ABW6FYG8_9PSEU|nr:MULTISPECIES: TetR/AcrR family transcriptional regulator [Prauserella salsuginis group]MCR3720536.1 transcriptional regulator, TetR family [Prauserella flava]MCR3733754.1 transcriptional regulator, TetR family [Prauserella salsuginis]